MSERLLRIEEAMDQLPAHYREAILHVKYEGMSLDETAEAMERTKGSVRMLLSRAIALLTSLLTDDDDLP